MLNMWTNTIKSLDFYKTILVKANNNLNVLLDLSLQAKSNIVTKA